MIMLVIGLLVLDIIVVSFLIESRKPQPYLAFFITCCIIAGYHFLVRHIEFNSILEYAKNNIWTIILYVLAWIFIGVIWSFIRWYILLIDTKIVRKSYDKEKLNEIDSHSESYYGYHEAKIPEAKNHKEKIISWMIYFPYSMLGVIFRNWISRLYMDIYNRVSGIYDRMNKSVFK